MYCKVSYRDHPYSRETDIFLNTHISANLIQREEIPSEKRDFSLSSKKKFRSNRTNK